MNMRGLKRREPAELDLASETPTVLQDILDLHRTHYGYNLVDLAKAVAANPSKLIATYQLGEKSPLPAKTTLRLVKA